jgi:hypothetical protein
MDCDVAIAAALGKETFKPQFYRPACGLWTSVGKKVLAQLNKLLPPINHFGWDTNVTRHTYRNWIAATRRAARIDQGGIFALHDRRLRFWAESNYNPNNEESSAYRGWVPDAASELIGELRSDGFTFLDPWVWTGRHLSVPINERPLDSRQFPRQANSK